MKRKAISILVAGLVMASFAGCGAQAETANSAVSGQSLNETVAVDGEQIAAINETDKNSDIVDEGAIINDSEDIVFYDDLVEDVSDEPALAEDVTDGNIVLYGGEKNPQKYCDLDEGIPEEINVMLTNVEADIPLYSWDGRLCGHLNKGGSIVVTEHCTVANAWYRFPNPIEGTEHEYLYVLRYETVMSSDEKARIEEIVQEVNPFTEILNAPDSDMNCYEFSIARKDYSNVANFLLTDEFDSLDYYTFYVECTRNGDYFDCQVYYK